MRHPNIIQKKEQKLEQQANTEFFSVITEVHTECEILSDTEYSKPGSKFDKTVFPS